MTDLTAATPLEIDTKLAELDGEYNKILGRRESVLNALRSIDGQRAGYVGRKRVFTASAEETLNSVAAKLAAGTLPAWEVADAERYIDQLVAIANAAEANRAETVPFDAEYDRRPWQRYFQVLGGKIHSGMWCQGGSIRWSTRRGWQPELSGNTVEQAVEKLGHHLCSKCFPQAPVAPKSSKAQQGQCEGSGTWDYSESRTGYYSGNWGKCNHCGEKITVSSTGKMRAHK